MKFRPTVDTPRCTGCGRCVAACPERIFSLEVAGYRKHAVPVAGWERCTRCGNCIVACPVGALSAADPSEPEEPEKA